jgi:hypothetical protein
MVTKEDGDGQRRRKRTPPDNDGSTLAAAGEELPERWSVQRKTDLVPRLLRGEGQEGIGISRASGLVPDANLHLSHLRVGQVEGDRFSGAAEMSGAGRTDARAQRAEVGWAGADCQPGGGRWGGLGAGPIIPTNGTP